MLWNLVNQVKLWHLETLNFVNLVKSSQFKFNPEKNELNVTCREKRNRTLHQVRSSIVVKPNETHRIQFKQREI